MARGLGQDASLHEGQDEVVRRLGREARDRLGLAYADERLTEEAVQELERLPIRPLPSRKGWIVSN